MQVARSKEYSSLPIILGIASAIVVSASGGWIVLDNKTSPEAVEEPIAQTPLANLSLRTSESDSSIDIDAELRKARLSAEADLLVSPPEQNALYFYGRVLTAEPGHRVARAELDALIALISLIVDDHLAANEFDEAYDLALSVSRHMPDHPMVVDIRNDLNEYAADLVADATRLAKEGEDDEAMATLSALEGLPGLSTDYVDAAQQVVLEAQQTRLAAEQEVRDAEQAAKEKADADWQQRISDAIAAGELLTPEGNSARDILDERDVEAEIKDSLAAELQAALIAAGRDSLEAGEVSDAEAYLLAASDFAGDDDALELLRTDVEQALIEKEGSAIVALAEFVRISTEPARYPDRASKRNIAGWVDVAFTVTATGQTSDIEILRAEPANIFDDSVIDAVQKWTFVPRQYRGQPIDQRTAARLVFNLE